jgi:SDR family mycofactocin-dependent oxidoreductase
MEGKVVVITGAARGQGRAHAVRLAEEGADILAIDICEDIDITEYPMATPEDLDETVRLVEKAGRRIVAKVVDVRDRVALDKAVADGVEELGRLDVIIPNAGIGPTGAGRPIQAFTEVLDVNLSGVLNTVHSCLPYLNDGGSVIMIGSVVGLITGVADAGPAGPGGAGYSIAKQTIALYTTALALQLAERRIRVNAIHPANVNTQMIQNEATYRMFRPDLEHPTREDAEEGFYSFHCMPVPYIEPDDVSQAVLFLASDESKFITGVQLKVDAGSLLRFGK